MNITVTKKFVIDFKKSYKKKGIEVKLSEFDVKDLIMKLEAAKKEKI